MTLSIDALKLLSFTIFYVPKYLVIDIGQEKVSGPGYWPKYLVMNICQGTWPWVLTKVPVPGNY